MRASKFMFLVVGIGSLKFAALSAALSTTSTVDGGGGRSSAGVYINDVSIGDIGGISSAGSQVTRHGFVGQLTEVSSVSVTGTPAQVNETATTLLSGSATLDDDTLVMLTGTDVQWGAAAWPVASINASGVASTTIVYQDTPAAINGAYLGVNGSGALLVRDSIPDNYGSYAGDNLPDWWQVRYFKFDNPDATPTKDVTGTGQNNLFKYTAGLDPTNAASVFKLRIVSVPGQPDQKQLVFSPRWNDRTYTPLYRTNLVAGASWTNLTGAATNDNGTERTVTDISATEKSKFYRIQITYP